jgi:hypothetical protein
VAVPLERDQHRGTVLTTFTEDPQQMAKWLMGCGVTTVAMESTGVYWIPLYEVLEQHGLKPWLGNARNMKMYRAGGPTGTSAGGCSFFMPWDCCGRPSARKPRCAQWPEFETRCCCKTAKKDLIME